MTMDEWTNVLHPDVEWKGCYPLVAQEVKQILDVCIDQHFSTQALVDMLIPVADVRGPIQAAARRRLMKAVLALARHDLASYATLGPAVAGKFGHIIHPYRWHRAEDTERCWACGQLLPKGQTQ